MAAVHSSAMTSVFLPTLHQELLLKTCLFEGEDAQAAWQAWRAEINLDCVDTSSLRLLPLLADKLQCLGVKDPAFRKYRGFERRTWVHNHLLFLAAGIALRRLRAAQVPAMTLKGAVLASTYYKTMSLRPMNDLDLMVRPVDGFKALDLLEGLGWRAKPGQLRPRTPIEFVVRAACALEHPANPEVQIILNWRLFWARLSEEAEIALWERAVWFEISGAECLAPCAADMLLHVCAEGAAWTEVPQVQWIVDAAFLVRSDTVDWTYFCVQAERLGLSLPLAETLNYLRTVMRVPVPDTVVRKLTKIYVRPIEQLIYESMLQPPGQMNVATAFRIHRHIAQRGLKHLQGPSGYWRYFVALRRGRSFPELARWLRRRLAQSVNS